MEVPAQHSTAQRVSAHAVEQALYAGWLSLLDIMAKIMVGMLLQLHCTV
jgi:hypothetical protein